MKIAVSNQVSVRNRFGQFISACEDAAEETAKEAVQRGERLARQFAPEGHKVDLRTIPLKQSISSKMLSRTSGVWEASARHALPQELGAGPHDIPANVSFFWEREGRMWMHPDAYLRLTGYPGADPIQHPGNAPQPYMRPAYEIVSAEIMAIARKHYPG